MCLRRESYLHGARRWENETQSNVTGSDKRIRPVGNIGKNTHSSDSEQILGGNLQQANNAIFQPPPPIPLREMKLQLDRWPSPNAKTWATRQIFLFYFTKGNPPRRHLKEEDSKLHKI